MDLNLFDKIAALSALSFEGAERASLARDMESILRLMDTVAQAEVSEEERWGAETAERLRADQPAPSLPAEDLLANAKERQGNFFAVPNGGGSL